MKLKGGISSYDLLIVTMKRDFGSNCMTFVVLTVLGDRNYDLYGGNGSTYLYVSRNTLSGGTILYVAGVTF